MSSSLSGFTGMGKSGSQGGTGSSSGMSMRGDIVPKGYNLGQLQQFTPEQQGLFQQLFGHVGPDSFLSGLAGGDEAAFERVEGPALKQFSGLQGNLASRFSGSGGLGARHSSGFGQAQTSAASDFAQQLQSNRMGLQRQALMDLMGMSNQLLGQRPQERFVSKKPQKQLSFLQQLGLGLSGGIGEGLGQGISTAIGAAF